MNKSSGKLSDDLNFHLATFSGVDLATTVDAFTVEKYVSHTGERVSGEGIPAYLSEEGVVLST